MARDYSSYSKEALIAHIYELEKQLKNNKYGLYWDKSIEPEEVVTQCKTNIPILKREDELCMLDNKNTDTHILIEGDNFHALTTMNMMCGNEGLVDIIYIDPPYNRGKDDFIYNDNYVDAEDCYRHSKWLDFIEKRLVLAKRIMKSNGLIFISIDDREQANLKILCDQTFGERNFVSCFSWMKTATASNLSKTIRNKVEYVLCYKKGELDYIINGGLTDGGDVPLLNNSNRVATIIFPKDSLLFKIKDGEYEAGKKDKVVLEEDIRIVNGYATKDVKLTGKFKWTQDTVNSEVDSGTSFVIKTEKFSIRFQRPNKAIKTPANYISKDECSVGTNEEGAKIVKDIFGYEAFDYTKPVSLIKYLVNMNGKREGIVLDFFTGSGTTGQAVLELNKEDGGHRKCILCTNNEGNICTDVTYPRLKTVITGKRQDGSEYSEGIPANLMYYKTDFIEDSRNTDQAKYSLVEKVDELLCIIEETYVCKGRTEYYSHYQSFDGNRNTFIYSEYYSEEPFKELVQLMEATDGEKTIYMFSTDNTVDEKLLEGIGDITLKPIPSKIYEIYKEIVEDIKRGE